MCVQNLKFVALPVPEIIGDTRKIWAVPEYAHTPFSPKIFNELLFGSMIILTVRTHGQQQQKTDIYRARTHG